MLRQPRTKQRMLQMMPAEPLSMQADMVLSALLELPETLLTAHGTMQALLDDLQVRLTKMLCKALRNAQRPTY